MLDDVTVRFGGCGEDLCCDGSRTSLGRRWVLLGGLCARSEDGCGGCGRFRDWEGCGAVEGCGMFWTRGVGSAGARAGVF